MRRLIATLALVALFAGMALAQVVNPTDWDANQQVGLSDAAGDTANVTQTLTVDVPKATALHLTVGELTFDINNVGNYDNEDWYCTYGPASNTLGFSPLDNGDFTDGGSVFGAADPQVMPMGTYYEQTTAWDQITIVGGGEVTSYPPVIRDATTGSVDNASKRNFVCYRTFVLQTFSNWDNFTLTVERDDSNAATVYPEPVYIQGNMECYIHAGTGLFALDAADPTANLIPSPYNGAPTGAQCDNADSSWQDALVVVGVKIDGEHWGPSTTDLIYTLTSFDD